MIEFRIDNVGFRVDKIEDLKQLIEQELLKSVLNTLYSISMMYQGEELIINEENLGFEIGEDDEEFIEDEDDEE